MALDGLLGKVWSESLLRVLYRPRLYSCTPVWDEFENLKGTGAGGRPGRTIEGIKSRSTPSK